MEVVKTNQEGINLIKRFETYRSKPYICPTGHPTIGFGTTVYPNGQKVKMTDSPITLEKANEILQYDLAKFEKFVIDLVKIKLTSNQFSALVSWTYNLGPDALRRSTMLKKINANPNDPSIADEIKRWNKGSVNGVLQSLPGLVTRRNAEAELYFKD